MRPRAAALGLLAALCGVGLLGATRPLGLGDVTDVRHWSYKGYTRVVVQLSRPSASAVKRLPANAAAGRPERLFVDQPRIWVGRRSQMRPCGPQRASGRATRAWNTISTRAGAVIATHIVPNWCHA